MLGLIYGDFDFGVVVAIDRAKDDVRAVLESGAEIQLIDRGDY